MVIAKRGVAGRALHAAAVGVVVLSLAACGASIPESGPVVEGPAVNAPDASQFIRVIARPPALGASPTEIVRGFLEASASFQDDYAVARLFLSADAVAKWNPSLQTRVYEASTVRIQPVGTNIVSVVAPQVGSIDRAGSYTVAEPGAVLEQEFKLVRESGNWRISTPPLGLLLSRGDVDRGYRTYSAFFLDPQFRTLVPDPITVPSTGSGAATTLIRRLVAGPTEWLAPAVRTAFPNGATLTVDSVPIDNGIAEVNLDAQVLASDERTRSALSAQIVWTLRQIPEVVGVRIRAGGVPLPVPGQPPVQSRDAWPEYDPDAIASNATSFAITDRGVASLTPGLIVPVIGPAGKPDQPLTTLAVSPDGSRFAGVDSKQQTLLESASEPGGSFRERATGKALASVGYGPDSSLWWIDGNAVYTLSLLGSEPQPVVVEGVDDARVVGLSLSRDGTRAALLLRRGPRTEVALARVERRGDSVRIAGARRIESRVSSAIDVVWKSSNQIVALGTEGAGALQVFTITLGADPVRMNLAPAKSVSVSSAPSRLVLVGTTYRSVQKFDGVQWSHVVSGTSPAYPG